MNHGDRDKNPFFLPALIMILIPVTILVLNFGGVHLILVTPYVALVLSVAGLITAMNRQKRFVGCVFCLVLSVLELLIPAYLSHNIHHEHTIATRSLSPEESASIEIVNEEINRALKGETITATTKSTYWYSDYGS